MGGGGNFGTPCKTLFDVFYFLNVSMDKLKMRNIGFCFDFYFTICVITTFISQVTQIHWLQEAFHLLRQLTVCILFQDCFIYAVKNCVTYPWSQDD